MDDLTDQRLLRDFCAGDRAAFDALYRRHASRVHATAYRLTHNWEEAEDTLQEVFLKLARTARDIRRQASLSTWIYRATVNRAIDSLRRRRARVSLDAPGTPTARIIALESLRREAERCESRRRDELLRRVEALIPRLPERQAGVFVLRFFQGLSHAEIAGVLGCSLSSSKSHHSLAVRKLREWVAQEEAADRAECRPQIGREVHV